MSILRTSTSPTSRSAWVAIGVVAGLVLAVALGPALAPRATRAVDDTEPDRTISVGGTGTVTIAPDVADLHVGVVVQRPRVADAQAAAATAMDGVVRALRAAGVAERDIRTTTLSLQPVYDYNKNDGPPTITGYELRNGVVATIRDLARLSGAVDGALAGGGTTLDGITFRVDDPSGAENQARSQAMQLARAKADALASAAGVSIIGVASISEQSAPTPWPVPYLGAARADAVATPILPGTSEISVQVSVVYLIR
ncbi:MAG TPA: SIMPL domain-containing protein [Patescibacteria group bacterium]|nr:SIMPL domain-containing protein [Patescibacteria group bacterium]